MNRVLSLLVLLSLILSTAGAQAANRCSAVFIPQSAAVRKVVTGDAYKQWLLWEQKANLAKYEKPTATIPVPLVELPADAVKIVTTKEAPQELINLFRAQNGNVLWAKHPYNKDTRVPYVATPEVGSIPVYMTSSRSLALDGALRGFTIKLATDHPHGPRGEKQPGKIQTNDDVDSALIHTEHLKLAEKIFGNDPKLVMLGEVMTMAEAKTGIGMVVRDVRAMDDGHYYLPALSIPFVGREIARLNNKSFEEFFEENYAALLGETKARLLLRTGLQMLTPNPQNMLIQLDRNLKPTGKMIYRDISDAYLVEPVAKGLGFEKQIELDNAVGYPPKKEINPFWSNSSWRFDEAGTLSVDSATTNSWGRAHNRAYVEFIKKELGLEIKENLDGHPNDSLREVYEALKSDIGQAKLKEYKERNLRERRQRRQEQRAS